MRKLKGLSQEALARRVGVSLSAINQLERGISSDPHYSTLSGIAAALNMSVAELVGDSPLSYGGERFKHYFAKARNMDSDELWHLGRELNRRVDELSKDPALLPRKLGGDATREERGQHFRELTEAVAELRAIAQVVAERGQALSERVDKVLA